MSPPGKEIVKAIRFPETFEDSMFLIYRTRFRRWLDRPGHVTEWDVICGAVWAEDEVRRLGDEAVSKGHKVKFSECGLAFDFNPNHPPDTVFVPAQMAMSQDDPLALEFSEFIPLNAYLTREEAERYPQDWDDVWEFRMPWISPFLLSPFTLDEFPEGNVGPHKFSL